MPVLRTFYEELYFFVKDIYERRHLIVQMAQRDIKSRYTGSFLGPLWIVLEPLSFMLVLWFIFGIGLRGGGSSEGVPFIVYLASGMIAWFFFAQTFTSAALLVEKYSFLVNKVDFRLGILPFVNIAAGSVAHVVLITIVGVIAAFNGVYPSFYFFQILYYFVAMSVFLLGLSWLVSALNVFVRDTSKLVVILVNFGFWLTPIFWRVEMIPEKYRFLIYLNPMHYIVGGYRDSIIYGVPFWEKPAATFYFWLASTAILLTGAIVFKRLRPHFSHVL